MEVANKILAKYIEVLPIEQTYFLSVDKPAIKKLTKELVLYNYKDLSPFSGGDVVFCVDRKKLYLWFTKEKLSLKKVFIPESYLIFKKYGNYSNAFIIVDKKDKRAVLVIKEGYLKSQIVANSIDVEILKKEYSIEKAKTVKADGRVDINIKFLPAFIPSFVNIDVQSLFTTLLEAFKLPLIVFFLYLNIATPLFYLYANHILKNKKTEYLKIKNKNLKIKSEFEFLERQKQLWDNFERDVLSYPPVYVVLNAISKVVLKHNGSISFLAFKGDIVDFWVESDSSSALVNDFSKIGYFKNIQILNTLTTKSNKERAHINLRLKRMSD